MKYIVVLCDGMSDLPCPELAGKTPMEYAFKPHMDSFAQKGEVGLVQTVPKGFSPGSDIANLSAMGYDPAVYYSGRSPLEAVSLGIDLAGDDVALRCNLVSLSESGNYDTKIMKDYCGGDISTEEAAQLIAAVQETLGNENYRFYPGFSYRHCLVWKGGSVDITLTPPHDISGKAIGEYTHHDKTSDLTHLMRQSYELLKDHPVNLARIEKGLLPANSIWLWGQGSRPNLDNFHQKTGLKGAVISAVDLLMGIGKCAGMKTFRPEGATGYIDTRFDKKVEAVFGAFDSGSDYVYLHIEAPDECGHRGEAQNKVKSIEMIDAQVLAPLKDGLKKYGRYRMLIMPDHPTPLVTRTHSSDPVPYILYDSGNETDSGVYCFTEASAAGTGIFIDPGHMMIDRMIM